MKCVIDRCCWVVCVNGARLAQSVEHEALNLRVVGSSPTSGVLVRVRRESVCAQRALLKAPHIKVVAITRDFEVATH